MEVARENITQGYPVLALATADNHTDMQYYIMMHTLLS